MNNKTVLLTTLGTLSRIDGGTYRTSRYRFADDVSREWEVPLCGLVELFRPTRVVAFCTEAACDTYDYCLSDMQQLGLPTSEIKRVLIPVPNGPEEMHELAGIVAEHARADEPTHLDLTFGLRSISYLSFLVCQILQQTERLKLDRLTYVNWEESRDGVTEVIDLTEYLKLTQLASAAAVFDRTGDVEQLAGSLTEVYPDALDNNDIEGARRIQENLGLLRAREIASKSTGSKLLRRLPEALESKAAARPLLRPFADRLRQALAPLDPGEENALSPGHLSRLARWYVQHGQSEKALLLLSEANLYLCAELVLEQSYPITKPGRPNDYYSAADYTASAASKMSPALGDRLRNLVNTVREMRNPLAHAGLGGPTGNRKGNAKSIAPLVDEFESLWKCVEAG